MFTFKSRVWALSPFRFRTWTIWGGKGVYHQGNWKTIELSFFFLLQLCDFVTSPFVTCISKANFHVAVYRQLKVHEFMWTRHQLCVCKTNWVKIIELSYWYSEDAIGNDWLHMSSHSSHHFQFSLQNLAPFMRYIKAFCEKF